MTQILKNTHIPPGDKELDKPIGQGELIKACSNLKNGKSGGVDGILNEMSKYWQSVLTLKPSYLSCDFAFLVRFQRVVHALSFNCL